jgi:hypothetical protein
VLSLVVLLSDALARAARIGKHSGPRVPTQSVCATTPATLRPRAGFTHVGAPGHCGGGGPSPVASVSEPETFVGL